MGVPRETDPSKWTAEQRDTWAIFANDYNTARGHFMSYVEHMRATRGDNERSNLPLMIAVMLRADAAIRKRPVEFILEGVILALGAIEGAEKILGHRVIERIEPRPSKVPHG